MIFFVEKICKWRSASWPVVLYLMLIAALLVMHAVSLRFYPPVFVDEAFLISRAWGWLQTGLNFGPLDAGVYEKKFEGFWTFHPLIPTWFHALFVQLFGLDLSLLRLASLLCGVGLLLAVFSIARQLSASSRCASIAVLLVATSSSFLISTHHIRYDIIVAALSFGAIAMYLGASNGQSAVLGVLSGLFLGLAFEVHVNAVIYGPVILALAFAENGSNLIRQRVFWGFAGGAAVVLTWYLWAHVVRYPGAYFGIGRGLAGTHYPPLLANPLAFLTALTEMTPYLYQTQFRVVATLIAALLLLRSGIGKRPLLMFLVGSIAFATMIKSKMYYYLILIEPFSDIVLALWIEQFVLRKHQLDLWSKLGRWLTMTVLSVSVLLNVAVFIASIASPPANESTPVAKRIERVVPEGGSVMGAQTYWFDLYQYRYLSWQNILAYRRYQPESTFGDAMAALRPDVLVLDDHLRQFILPDQPVSPMSGLQRYLWERRLPKSDVEAFLANHGILKDRVETHEYGTVEIYLLNWNE